MRENNILGISAGFHDAAASVIDGNNGKILFASHSERFSKKKHDKELSELLIDEALQHGTVSTIAYYENHWLKKARQLFAGQKIDNWRWSLRSELTRHMPNRQDFIANTKLKGFGHHKSHAAAGFQTSPYEQATVVVIDAIGEFDTITIWNAYYDNKGFAKYKLRWRQMYPNSIGMFYSAITNNVGLRPMDEEYILMGMAAYGDASLTVDKIKHKLVESIDPPRFKENLHIGIDDSFCKRGINKFDVAAGAQQIVEEMIMGVMNKASTYKWNTNLVFAGGVALNCSANRLLGNYFKDIWIMPNPGDAGSSLGAAALAYGKKLQWDNAFLGYNIAGPYPVDKLVEHLHEHKIAGVANGKAEFGPRALGNRSLLADPRGTDIKDKVNAIKRRQQFRPFAPVVLAEHAADYFNMPMGFSRSDYMQVTAKCMKPDEFPAVIHEDGTSRVQTVPDDDSGIRKLLERWYAITGCPMLLNTSLNIRGEPMVNDVADAKRFEEEYGITVFTSVL